MARNYTPRRASKRWLKDAPAYVLDCFDNKGKTADRYTVIFGKEFMVHYDGLNYLSLLDMSENPFHPQGVGLSGEYPTHQIAAYRYRCKHHRTKWNSLPDLVKRCVTEWAKPEGIEQ